MKSKKKLWLNKELLIVVSTFLNLITLDYFKTNISDTNSIFALLASGYFISSIIGVIINKKKLYVSGLNRSTVIFFLVWTFSISFIFILFFYFQNLTEVNDIILAQAIAPYLGAILSLDIMRDRKHKGMTSLIPVIILLSIVYLKTSSLDIKGSYILISIISLFTLAQLSIRIIIRRVSISTIYIYGGIVISLILSIFMLNFTKSLMPAFNYAHYLGYSLITGLVIFLVQFLFLKGLQNSSAKLSAIAISSGIPISNIYYFKGEDPTSIYILLLSFSYILAVTIMSISTTKQNTSS